MIARICKFVVSGLIYTGLFKYIRMKLFLAFSRSSLSIVTAVTGGEWLASITF